jgi:hypothetical protein
VFSSINIAGLLLGITFFARLKINHLTYFCGIRIIHSALMFTFLFRPFPSFSATAGSLRMSAMAGLCVFGILVFFQPFGLHELSTQVLLKSTSIYGLATFAVSALVVFVFPLLLPSVFDERHWTVAHEIGTYVLLLSLVAVANVVINGVLYDNHFSLDNFLSMLMMVVGVGILPVTIGVLVKQKILLKKFETAATTTDALLISGNSSTKAPNLGHLVRLCGTNRNEVLELMPNHLLMITASDNYVEIYFEENDGIQKKLFRNTLKAMENAVANHPQFYRCHKAYIVNLKKVVHISGNAQGLKLEIEGFKNLVPVSRNLTVEIKEKLKVLAATSPKAGH